MIGRRPPLDCICCCQPLRPHEEPRRFCGRCDDRATHARDFWCVPMERRKKGKWDPDLRRWVPRAKESVDGPLPRTTVMDL